MEEVESLISIFKKFYYSTGTHLYIKNEHGSFVEKVISDVEIKYHQNVHYERMSVIYTICNVSGYGLESIVEDELTYRINNHEVIIGQ